MGKGKILNEKSSNRGRDDVKALKDVTAPQGILTDDMKDTEEDDSSWVMEMEAKFFHNNEWLEGKK